MTAQPNPYEILGVAPDATPEQIKRAYREKAKTAHPDAGGNGEQFGEISRAVIVLMDPAKREKFDRTGTMDEDAPDNATAHAVGRIVAFFHAAADNYASGLGPDPSTLDLVAGFKKFSEQHVAELEKRRQKFVKMRAALLEAEGRLTKKKKANPIVQASIKAHAESLMIPVRQIEAEQEQFRDAVTLIDGFSFDVLREMPITVQVGGTGSQSRFFRGGFFGGTAT